MNIASPLVLIAAGGASNILDRIQLGYVRDPLVLGSLYFNVADICIAIGITWAVYVLYQYNRV